MLRQFIFLFISILIMASLTEGNFKNLIKPLMQMKKLAKAKVKVPLNPKPIGASGPLTPSMLKPQSGIKLNMGEQRMASLPKIHKRLGEMPG
uniref:Hypothetical secreted peptide n=1 Tax=Simulium vittatum TaxID=7192 RepID=B5M0N2_SIMVI|nr:hypothetical secreted peptide precursor [Simulium vittatum]